MQSKLSPLQVALLSCLIPATAFAEDATTELAPIIISADFRTTETQNSTTSVTVIQQTDINKRSAQQLENILNLAPNVNTSGGGARTKFYQIRGIGERGQFSTPINPSVGLIIDGIDYSRTGAAGILFDTKQVEILRGPQGTHFGANALAGMILLQSNEPTAERETHIEYTVGNRNTQSLGVATGGTLINDQLLGRISLHKHLSDGYMENKHLNRNDTQNQDELNAKAQLKWLVSDDLTVDFTVLHLDIDNGYDGFNFNNDYTTNTDQPGKDTLKSDALAIKTTWDINPKVTMETSLAYSDSDLEYSYDDDWSYVGEFDASLRPYSAVDQYLRDRKNNTIDMRFLSSESERIYNGSTDWVAGLYRRHQDESLVRNYDYVYPYGTESSTYTTTNTAVYGQLDHHLNSKTILTTGLRLEQFDASYKNSYSFSKETSELLYGGKLTISHQLNDAHLGSLSLSRGYKAGGVNDDSSLPAEKLKFNTEYLWNLEAGLNSSLLNNRLKTRLTAFYAQRHDQQVNSSTQKIDLPEFTIYLDNAAEGKNFGLELELDWTVNAKLRLKSSLGLLNSTFTNYTYVDPKNTSNTINLDNREQASAPTYQYSIGSEYTFSENWIASANIEGKDAFYFSNSHNAQSKAYNIVNASLEYLRNNWVITLWSRNLLNTEYDVRGYHFGINPGIGYADATYTQKGEPRAVGVTVAWDY